jgi:hypothetical protein
MFSFALSASAATLSIGAPATSTSPKLFETNVGIVTRMLTSDVVEFNIDVKNIDNPEKIAFWKVRTYCDTDMAITFASSTGSQCEKNVTLNSLTKNSYSFLFDNKTDKLRNFSVKLKAYDKNGMWMHSERESFRWK